MEAWQHWRDAGDARTFFRAVAKAITDMERWRTIADEGVDALALPASGHGSGISDPTANRAIWLVDNDGRVRAEARRRLKACEDKVGAGLVVIAYVRRYLGARYAEPLDAHYIEGESIRSTAARLGVGVTTAKGRIAVACDWLDALPTSTIFGFRPPVL